MKFIILITVLTIIVGCKKSDKATIVQSARTEEVKSEEPYVTPPTQFFTYEETTTPTESEGQQKQNEEVTANVQTSKETKLSDAYKLGYEQGYIDGEDDCVFRNGYRGQYNPQTKLKGKQRKDFLEGYNDGYEDGYDETMADDGSDEIYE